MKTDKYDQIILTENDLCDLYMRDHTRIIKDCLVDEKITLGNIFPANEK